MEIKYKVVDNLPNTNLNDYMKNVEIKKVLNKISNLDMNNTTFQQAFNILLEIQNKLKILSRGIHPLLILVNIYIFNTCPG